MCCGSVAIETAGATSDARPNENLEQFPVNLIGNCSKPLILIKRA
jgi:hypothetical protein